MKPGFRTLVLPSLVLAVILYASFLVVACGSSTTATTGTSGGLVTASSGTASTRGAEVRVDIKNLAFNPASITVKAGDTVTWTNSDSMAHTVTADNGEFDSGNLAAGASFSFMFQSPGTFPYHCTIHPSMTATVIVQ